MAKITLKLFKLALEGTFGIKSKIAENLNVCRSSVGMYIKKNPKLNKLLEDERVKMLDIGENALMVNVKAGDTQSIKFLLSTQGKDKGYVERTESKNLNYLVVENRTLTVEEKKLLLDDIKAIEHGR